MDSAAGQITEHLGVAKAIGSAGSAEKIEYLKHIGFDEAFNYKDGGDHLEAATQNANTFGCIAICGAIAQYNDAERSP